MTKDIHANHPVMLIPGVGAPLISRTGTVKAESSFGSEDDIGRSKDGAKADFVAKADHNADNLFIEDVRAYFCVFGRVALTSGLSLQIRSAIDYHYGEGLVRVRFTEYVTRFVRLASRYEEEVTGTTQFGYPSATFIDGSPSRPPQLGSGIFFNDEPAGMKELTANAHRVEAWRKTSSYKYCVMVCGVCRSLLFVFDAFFTICRISARRRRRVQFRALMWFTRCSGFDTAR